MKFKLLSINSNTENESDYETAVDMSHSTINELEYKIETPSGVILALSSTHISTSYSYMEPDFDRLDETGEMVYERYPSNNPNKESNYTHATYELSPLIIHFTNSEFSEYFENYLNRGDTDYTGVLKDKFEKFENQQSGYSDWDTVKNLSITAEEQIELMKNISYCLEKNQTNKGDWLDISISKDLTLVLKNIENEQNKIKQENQMSEVLVRLNNSLQEDVEKHLNEMKVKPLKLK